MSCCTIGHIATGSPRGTLTPIRDILTYLTYPIDFDTNPPKTKTHGLPKWERAILLCSEGHGIEFPNIQLVADSISQKLNCPVIAPNLLGDASYPIIKPEGWDGDKELELFQIRHQPETVDPILREILDWMDTPTSKSGFGGVEYLGGIGYCFGGRYVIRLLAEGKIDVGVVNHPSFFTIDEVKSLEKMRPSGINIADTGREAWSPLAIFAAEDDDIFPETKRRETEDSLKSIGATWSCTTFSQTDHGFSVRGDPNDKATRFATQSALQGAVSWFDEYLGSYQRRSVKE
ncbi:hypothetical protein FQN54_002572 [Arachnomyces sp. PD_36]|nr:hypothetical protein FQN54_002572 [Arachnomyces sp. PD_36]